MIIDGSIRANNIYLRSLVVAEDGMYKYCAWINDPEVNEFLSTKSATIDGIADYVEDKNKSSSALLLGVFLEDGRHVGNVKLEPIDEVRKIATFGIMIGDKSVWGKGIGTEATKTIVNYAFNDLDMNIVRLGVMRNNTPAIRIYERLGFKETSDVEETCDITMEISKESFR